eukprot:COSAG02_NODE_53272_length_303_cov_0.372549_1_plen_57_part_10
MHIRELGHFGALLPGPIVCCPIVAEQPPNMSARGVRRHWRQEPVSAVLSVVTNTLKL